VTSRRRRRSGRSTPWPEEDWTRENTIDRLRRFYEYRERRYAVQAANIEDDGHEDRTAAYQQTLLAVLAAQREALLRCAARARSQTR
jgi:hypothetical protein